jgi:putative holliday junction resolvase
MTDTEMTETPGRILALDYGTKRVGVAASDPTRLIAQGITTLINDANLFLRLKEIIAVQSVTQIVVGMPYSEDGGKGFKAREVEEFIAQLKVHTNVPIDTWDESLTSVDAHRVFVESGMKKKQRREKHRVDEMAARLMLQDYLDHHAKK